MIQPEDLRSATERVLHNLKADESLKHRIIEKTVSANVPAPRSSFKPVAVLCGILAAFLLVISAINGIQPLSDPGGISMFTAGNQTSKDEQDKPILNLVVLSEGDILSIRSSAGQMINDKQKCAFLLGLLEGAKPVDDEIDVQRDTITIVKSDGTENVFAASAPYLSADGLTWECRAFFDEIREMAEQPE